MLNLDPAEFHEKFNRNHFTLTHDLGNYPEFALPRLIELAKSTAQTRPADLYYDVGNVDVGQRWDATANGPLPIDETIRRLETQGAWIILFRAELDPAYARLLHRAMSDILEMTGPEIERTIKSREVILFITSPNRVTTYHIDRECNFLLQITGSKEISVFSRDDREVLPETEIERFWTVDNNAPRYRKDLQHRAQVIPMAPGQGIHIPVNAPHWVQNGDNVSVSASFNFQFRNRLRADLYRANHYLRRIGLHPAPPFQSPAADALRGPFGAAAYKLRSLYRGPRPRD